ncbi:BTAD domain-containing putative transcriptional regulator [Albidovulum sediminicola]|uniref:BTAD domain-containing putative transcriptional regulator n=1 Tax=Albidovulum sediminicola TaxID=2984331 RepID=UPI0021E761C8|nr:BTAD domain-containing putative transcriptional regulator [Defluviimonas sp. WL0075]
MPRQLRALLAWLALHQGKAVARETASALLWGDRPQKQANASLSQALYTLRKALGDSSSVVETDAETIRLSETAVLVDAQEFSRRAHGTDPSDLMAAAALYAAPFLEGFVAPTPEFEDWQITTRQRLRVEAVDVLTRLLPMLEEQGARAQMLEAAHRLQDLDPYSEQAARCLMRHYAAQDQIALACETYDHLQARLAEDLQTAPDPETAALHYRILAHRAPGQKAAGGLSRTRQRRPTRRRGVGGLISAGAVVVGIAAMSLLMVQGRPEVQPIGAATMAYPLPDKPSIAVLAFDDLSAGEDHGDLSDAISEGVIHQLSRFPELFVIARNSSFHYRGTATDIRQISRELGVRYILEGSQQKNGDRLRVTAQLIDAPKGNHVWAERYDRDMLDLFAVQDEITHTVAATVANKLKVRAGQEAKRADPATLNAYQLWSQARQDFHELTREGNDKALRANLAALRADPSFANAYVGLAYVHVNGYRWGWTDMGREEALRAAREAAQKALALAPDDYAAHHAMAYVHVQSGELDAAIVRDEKALDLNPNATNAMAQLAETLGYLGRTAEAEDLLLRASRLDPFHPPWYEWNLGWIRWLRRDCKGALAAMQDMSKMPPLAHRAMAIIHVCLGNMGAARAEIEKLLQIYPDYSIEAVRLNFRGKYRNPADIARYLDDLRTAGLPETAPPQTPQERAGD